jgi:uncharacterized damage-inducible protein DinB
MDASEFFRMFSYDHWANRECIGVMRAANFVSADSIVRMAHILSAQKLWLERLLGHPQSLPVWPVSTIDDCAELSEEMFRAWRKYLADLTPTPSALDAKVEYRNTRGEPWSSRVEDILMHVLFHSAYHRGQIALQMRAAGLTPAPTDFIHAVRQGLVE